MMNGPGRFLIFTGEGKGKTTAALGMALRASGHGQKVRIVQFVKSDDSPGEYQALRSLPGVELIQRGCGFIPREQGARFEQHRQKAQEGLAVARALLNERPDLMILDEICVAVSKGLLDEDCVIEFLSEAPPATCVVMTGRYAPHNLVELADTVTEMKCVKHGYECGIAAQRGVEF